MNWVNKLIVRVRESQQGQTMTEYVLIVAAIAVAGYVAYEGLEGGINSIITNVTATLAGCVRTAPKPARPKPARAGEAAGTEWHAAQIQGSFADAVTGRCEGNSGFRKLQVHRFGAARDAARDESVSD